MKNSGKNWINFKKINKYAGKEVYNKKMEEHDIISIAQNND